jgi:hypothetical protein
VHSGRRTSEGTLGTPRLKALFKAAQEGWLSGSSCRMPA